MPVSISRSIWKCLAGLLLLVMTAAPVWNQPVNLVTFNIRYDNPGDGEDNWHKRKEKLVELILHYDAAVVGIQEGLYHQVEYIDSCLVNHTYIGVGRDDGKTKGEYSAIFYDTTRLRLIMDSTFWLSETPENISVGWDAAMERICTFGLFEHIGSGQKAWIFNTHFDHIGAVARANSARLILETTIQVNSDHLPLVVMGDLNAMPGEEPIQVLKAGLSDGMEVSVKPFYGPHGTFNGFTEEVVTRRIDYIFADHLKVLSYTHIDDRRDNNRHVSDHLPVMATVEFEK